MTQSRRIARNRRREMALAGANVSEFEVACRGETDHERRDARMRILDKVRDFAAHVHEPDLDKAWAYLQESRKDYVPGRDGLSELMVAVDTWKGMAPKNDGHVALCDKCRPPRAEECTVGHGPRPCRKCGEMFIGGCTPGEALPEGVYSTQKRIIT